MFAKNLIYDQMLHQKFYQSTGILLTVQGYFDLHLSEPPEAVPSFLFPLV